MKKKLPSLTLELAFLGAVGFAVVYLIFYWIIYESLPECILNLNFSIPLAFLTIGGWGGSIINKFRLRSILK